MSVNKIDKICLYRVQIPICTLNLKERRIKMIEGIVLPESVKSIFYVLNRNGYEAYIVGGAVRNSIIGLPVHDWDICTNASPEDVCKLFRSKGFRVVETGLQHGTVTVMVNYCGYEITTYRTDGKYTDSRHPDSVKFVGSIYEDLARRDFTMNAIAYNDDDGLIDPFNGLKDIENKIIRCVGTPVDRFTEDPLRIMRAVRFAAQLGFHIENYTNIAMVQTNDGLSKISAERIQSELCKILISDHPEYVLDYYIDISPAIPELSKMMGCSQNNMYHIYDVWNHTRFALTACRIHELETRLAILLHDIGKSESKTVDKGIEHFYGHAVKSAEITESLLRRLRFSNEIRKSVVELVASHDMTIVPKPNKVKKYLNKLGEAQFRRLLDLRFCDIMAHNPYYAKERLWETFKTEEILNEVLAEEKCFSIKDLAINGKDIMELGVKEGPDVGKWLKYALDEVINDRLDNDKEDILNDIDAKLYAEREEDNDEEMS